MKAPTYLALLVSLACSPGLIGELGPPIPEDASMVDGGIDSGAQAFNVEGSPTEPTSSPLHWHPGHYILFGASRRYEEPERNNRRLDYIRTNKTRAGVRGFNVYVEWDRLESSRGNYETDTMRAIGEWLNELEGTDKYLALTIRDRAFNADHPSRAPVPDYVCDLTGGCTMYDGYVALPRLWDANVNGRKIALMQAIMDRYGDHPRLVAMLTGESSVAGEGWTFSEWNREFRRFFDEVTVIGPHQLWVAQLNFFGGDDANIRSFIEDYEDVSGVSFGWPDTTPCRDPRVADYDCAPDDAYDISMYEIARDYRGRIPITPNVETWDVLPSEMGAIMDLATNGNHDSFESNYVFWQNYYSSRRHGDYPAWSAELYEMLARDHRINSSRPL